MPEYRSLSILKDVPTFLIGQPVELPYPFVIDLIKHNFVGAKYSVRRAAWVMLDYFNTKYGYRFI